ncbi:MAG: acetyl-CoA carboxylase biotin carboxyl carrier protein [Alphaproteobacteria bacterium]|nr:acetyl-CoA carboxylase biotin carboxyl carrier protein [Alphaproteobacteria bacterium]
MKIDSDAIRQLAELLDETGLTEIEVSEGEQAIRVSRGGLVTSTGPVWPAMVSDPTIPQAPSVSTVAEPPPSSHPGAVMSPMVGTVYMQPEPGAPSFIQKGGHVKAGDTLVIIEAMKVMNPIKAEKAGTVTQILVENGQPVEYGDVLVVIE